MHGSRDPRHGLMSSAGSWTVTVTGSETAESEPLSDAERERLAALRSARSLADLVALTGEDSEHEAYFRAKREWYDLRGRELSGTDPGDGIPGDTVVVEDVPFHVHGVTHANTEAEGAFLRRGVDRLPEGATVYCEQGIRGMYFQDVGGVCEMDDYRWAVRRCEELDLESHLAEYGPEFEGLLDGVTDAAEEFRDAVYSLIDSGSDVYGERFQNALGDVATAFLTGHKDMATGEGFEAHRLSRAAAVDPDRLVDLQRYYASRFLPQPVEREWLRRHDPELEAVSHARNERMADYAVHHHETAPAVHLVVGAAHQPGVTYYLERHRDGDRTVEEFELA